MWPGFFTICSSSKLLADLRTGTRLFASPSKETRLPSAALLRPLLLLDLPDLRICHQRNASKVQTLADQPASTSCPTLQEVQTHWTTQSPLDDELGAHLLPRNHQCLSLITLRAHNFRASLGILNRQSSTAKRKVVALASSEPPEALAASAT